MIVMLFVAQLLTASPVVAAEFAAPGNAGCGVLAFEERVVVTARAYDPVLSFANALARIKTALDEATERITASFRGVRRVVGTVMRSFTAAMLGARAFGRARPRS